MTPKFKVSVSIQETQRRSCCIQVCRAVFGMVMLGKVFPLSKSRDNSEGAWILKGPARERSRKLFVGGKSRECCEQNVPSSLRPCFVF